MDEQTSDSPDDLDDQQSAAQSLPLCLHCLEPCNPHDYYCPNCGSNEAINPLASYMPFVDIRFRVGMIGKLWRVTWDSKTPFAERACYVGIFLLFAPIFLLIGLPFVIAEKIKKRNNNSSCVQDVE